MQLTVHTSALFQDPAVLNLPVAVDAKVVAAAAKAVDVVVVVVRHQRRPG